MMRMRQKMLLHIYADAAELDDPSYRNLLREFAGVESSADRAMDQAGFETTMAALERVLFARVADGLVADPRPSRYIREEFYWRHRLPAAGYISTRQSHRIDELWTLVQSGLEPPQRSLEYLRGIMAKATGKRPQDIGLAPLTQFQASAVIEALQDRLSYARRVA